MKQIIIFVSMITGLVLNPSRGNSQVLFQGSTSSIGSGNPATVNLPIGTNGNDLLIVGVMLEKGAGVQITPPAGWTLIRRTNNGTEAGIATYYKMATAAEPSSYTFLLTNSPKWALGISRIAGADELNPINTSKGAAGVLPSVVAPSVTISTNNSLVLCFYTNKKNATYTPATGTIERYDAPNNPGGQPSNMMATFEATIAGSTGNLAATPSETEKWTAQQVVIQPALSGPLPMSVISFSAETLDLSVRLSWKTNKEINNDYMAIERSANGFDFTEIGKIKGAGTINETRNYSFTDDAPLNGINYYRLRQINYDGVYSYHKTIQVAFNKLITSLQIYPNPTPDILKIERKHKEAGMIRVFDQAGRIIIYKNLAGALKYELSLSNLKAGSYVLQLTDGNQVETKTFIKL